MRRAEANEPLVFEAADAYQSYIYYRCATDIELFIKIFFAHYCESPFNEFHKDHFRTYEFGKRGLRSARGAPRGYAKSTIKALFQPIHDLCYGNEQFIVIISNTDPQAKAKIKDIRNELLFNTLLIDFFRISFPTSKPAETEFTVSSINGSCQFKGFGSGAEVRGIRTGATRPSKIIMDDGEHSDEVESEQLREKFERRFQDVYMKLGNKHTNVEVIGTILHKRAFLSELVKKPLWNGKVFKSIISWSDREDLWEKWREILRDIENPNREAMAQGFYDTNEKEMLRGTRVLWPENEPYVYLMKELFDSGRRSFLKEKQNEPVGDEEKVFYPDQFIYYFESTHKGEAGIEIEKTGKFMPYSFFERYGVIDPSTGQRKATMKRKSDFTSLLTGLFNPISKRLFVHNAWLRREPPSVYIAKIFEFNELHKYQKFGVETNLYRNLLMQNIRDKRQELSLAKKTPVRLPLYDIEQVENKEKRIFTLEPNVSNGMILFNRALSPEFFSQMEEFPKGDHDDGPDSLEMLWGLVHNKYSMSPIELNAMDGR